MSFTIVKANITTICQKTYLWNNRSETKVALPLLPSLTDIFVGIVLTFWLLFKLYLHPYFLSIFSTSLAIMLVAILPIELLPSANGDTCFKCHRTFLMLLLSCEILASLTYSKINICWFLLRVELMGKKSYSSLNFFKICTSFLPPITFKGPHYSLFYY